MKNQFLLLIVLLCGLTITSEAKNFYVANSGNDANNGLTPATAWRTLSKVNASFAVILPGDNVLFMRGDVFYGALTVGKSGSSGKPITFSDYGTGAKPVISGFTTLSSWTSLGNGIYQAAAMGKATMNLVSLNGRPQALGRYPNATDANGGFLKYETFSGTSSITDNELTSSTNWTGAEAVIRKKLWVLDRCKITGHSGGTISYQNLGGSTYDGTRNYGYFIQNDPRTLDQLGEWYFNNSTKRVQMFFGSANPASYSVKAGTVDTLVTISTRSYITLNNLALEGANGMTVYLNNTSNITVQNCDISNAGETGITSQNTSNILIDNCTINHTLNNAIKFYNVYVNNNTIRNCEVNNTGMLAGMGASSGNSYKAIVASVLNNLVIEYNKVDSSGFVGIEFQGSNIMVNNNVVNYFCINKEDGGGIYTWSGSSDANPGVNYTNRVIKDNIIMRGMGAPLSRFTSSVDVSGIHLDGRSLNIDVLNNTIFDIRKDGIHTNNPINVKINGNTFFNNTGVNVSVMRWANIGEIRNLAVKRNINYTTTTTQKNFMYINSGLNQPVATTVQSAIRALGDIDSNYYNMANPGGFSYDIYTTSGGAAIPVSKQSLTGFQSFAGDDINSKKPAKTTVSYKLEGTVGSNKVANGGTFTSNILGVTLFGGSITGLWDNTNKINGGSFRMNFLVPTANRYGTIHSTIGAVTSSKKYILRFSTFGTTQLGMVNAYLRKTASPYTSFTPIQTKSFGIGRTDHEYLFVGPTTDAAASFVIEIEQNSGTTYLDNIQFFEANATVLNTDDQLRFEYNPTNSAKTIALDGSYTAVDGTVYNNTLTLQPYTSKIMVKDTGAASPLKAVATAAAVNCFGGTAAVEVTATGGTAPYTGTGTFTVTAGTRNYTVTDAGGATSTVSITVIQPAAALQAVATPGTITVPGGTTTVAVSATGGTAPYTGTGNFTVSAGTFNYTITDAKGCTSIVPVTVADGGSISFRAIASSMVDINCFGSSANVNVSAAGGTAPYTGTGSYPVSAGKGSLKLSFPTSISGSRTSVYFTIGAVSNTKNYVLKFSTLGTTSNGQIRAYIRMTGSPWATLVPMQYGVFGTTRKDHEFLFTAPQSQSAASFIIQIDQSSGTTYIDNVAFFEADTDRTLKSGNLYPNGSFEKGIVGTLLVISSNLNHVAVWDTTAIISGTSYFAVNDATNTTSVAVVNTTQPVAPLSVTATAGAINVSTGLAPVTVIATGGTAPYTGTGSFSRSAGTYTYTVTDANGCAASAVVTITTQLARGANPSATNPVTTSKASTPDAIVANNALTVNVFPNPSNTSFGLMVAGGSSEKITIMVYSYDGKPMYQATGNSNTKYTFGNNFATGVYIVKVVQGTSTQTLKLIKAN